MDFWKNMSKIKRHENKNAFLYIFPANYDTLSQEIHFCLELKAEKG